MFTPRPPAMSPFDRVVGGDFKTEIKVSSDDEVGQLEGLFEQFRRVFVDVLKDLPEFQEK